MKFEELLSALGEQAWFDYPTASLFFPAERQETLRTSLYRLVRDGRLISLRRGLYAFAPAYRKAELNGALIANELYRPSYLSELWALGWYGTIPEKVVSFTSVSSRPTRRFVNAWGTFTYRTLDRNYFSHYTRAQIMGKEVLIAEPGKALLDYWYLESGEWTVPRMASMRFNTGTIDPDRLAATVEVFREKRMLRALRNWGDYAAATEEGMVTI